MNDTARKRVVISDQSSSSPSVSFDAEFDGTESYDDDEAHDKRAGGARSWVSYVVLALMFLSGLVGMGQILRSSGPSGSIPRGPPIQYVEAPVSVASKNMLSNAPDTPMLRASIESNKKGIMVATNTIDYPSRPLKLPSVPALKSGEKSAGEKSPHVPPASPQIESAPSKIAPATKDSTPSVEELYTKLQRQIEEVRTLKRSGVVTETDDEAKALIKELRKTCREYLLKEYGPEPYYIEMSLVFPSTMSDFSTHGADGKVLFKLGPIEHVPYSVFYFLELVKNWKGGAFHRPAGHVLQALVHTKALSLAFQEYSPHFPHNKHTLGYAGRPSGPGFYISTVDNAANHGPGSQGSATEADACFGVLVPSPEVLAVVDRIKKQPGGQKPHMFVSPASNYIKIPSMKLITTRTGGLESLPNV